MKANNNEINERGKRIVNKQTRNKVQDMLWEAITKLRLIDVEQVSEKL